MSKVRISRWGRAKLIGYLPLALVIILQMASPLYASVDQRPLMRFPDINEDKIVFVYGEDIWTAPSEGGVASRLTINDGEERYPKFSPDGQMIAFSGEYDGNTDVYVMNTFGGDITRLTWHPGEDVVVGWHPLKNKIIFQSGREAFKSPSSLFLVSPDGTGLEKVNLYEVTNGSFSPDGTRIAYNKMPREDRNWKRYYGGSAQDIFIYDFETKEMQKITDFVGTDRQSMWIGDKIYFSSDRDKRLNMYSYDLESKTIEKITEHADFDIRRPSMGGDQIIYELGGALWVLDVNSRETMQVPVEIRTDAPEVRPYLADVTEFITDYDCSPSGKRALVVARGDLFTVPKEHGAIRNLTQNCGYRVREAVWSPDGKQIAYLSDQSGEYEIYVVDPQGKASAFKLTNHEKGYRHNLLWSPDSKMIAFADHSLRCYILDIATKVITFVDRAEYEDMDVSLSLKPIWDYSWSPDSRYLAYSKMNEDLVYQIHIYDIETEKKYNVSDGFYSDFNPVFTKDGKHLLIISNRYFDPTFCDFEWEMVYKKIAGIFCLSLKKDGQSILPFKNDEEVQDIESVDDGEDVVIDFDGIANRIEALPLPGGNYRELAINSNSLFYLNSEEGDYNRFEFRELGPRTLHSYGIDDQDETTVIERVDGYRLSADGSQVIYKRGDEIGIISSGASNSGGNSLNLSNLKMWIDPLKEWKQIFRETWRMERDFFYDSSMHGLDWKAIGNKYGDLLPYISCRQDLEYLIGEMIAELSTSHTYVYAGYYRREAERVNVGMLGVDWEIDEGSNRYRFGKIYRAPFWSTKTVPPLAKPGLNVGEGDYLLQINGEDVIAEKNIYGYFQNLARKQVRLTINGKPTLVGAREITVKPKGSEFMLRYYDWVEHNRHVVDSVSGGKVGYIHLPDTYTFSAKVFPKLFYSQTCKQGIIVDGRFNGGGLDPEIFLERLNKRIEFYWTRRYTHDQTTPAVATDAHLVCLTDRYAGSGGDQLPLSFKVLGMGPVIGTRTWGGLVGVSMYVDLVDGGEVTVPDYRIYDKDGKWIIENVGFQPDIEIDLDPAEMERGYDAQLMKAIDVLLQKIESDPVIWPEHEPYPDRSK